MNTTDIEQLQHRTALLENIFFNMASPMVYMDQDLRLILVNKAFAARTGQSPEFLVGKGYFQLYPNADREGIFRRVLKTAESYMALEDEFGDTQEIQGPETYWDWSLKPVKGDQGRVVGIILQLMEVTEQRLARDRWDAYREGLERSNRELQDFAYTASHDLQEPLRKIQAFGGLLTRKFTNVLGPDGLDYLDRMVRAASRMQHLIEALLRYSRVTTHARPFQPVDLNKSLKEALSNLENRIQETDGRVHVEGLPTIDADPYQMIQLFQNLVGNGLKFHRAGVPPVIRLREVLVQVQDTPEGPLISPKESCRIAVTDNGIGFDEIYLDRIFSPFQRLHGRSEYDGVGMGLSICRRIVERHGGRITAKSVKGEGSTFIVDLPRSQSEPDQK
ncbi:MAG: ATP-binding protein [Deltaproteobacteria bacterium]|nr:ATP-binding protein [Deltaproteobacteria bacterium]